MADATDQAGASPKGKILKSGVAGVPIDPCHAHFNQLVIVQGSGGLSDDCGGHPGVADPNQGFEWVGEAAKITPLSLIQLHPAIVVP